ncbi:MAG TPA: aminoglycoside phosphotransferase family protein [Solirubrobacteraceae bacterium]|nr:aminoglycoside phosphotransferase family protein [Solirubrobacteraceae bacterium]
MACSDENAGSDLGNSGSDATQGASQAPDATTDESAAADVPAVRRLIAASLPALSVESIAPLGEGTDHIAYLVDDRLVVRFTTGRDAILSAASVDREARLLTVAAAVSPIAVPKPVLVAPEKGCLAYLKLPGVPLLDLPQRRRALHAPGIAADLGRLLRALHAVAPQDVAELVTRDDLAPEQWLDEAAEHYATVAAAIPSAYRQVTREFLAAAAPQAPPQLRFSHNDLGIEHVLVDPRAGTVTGVLDWADAALADPARDFGLIYRDLGPAAAAAAFSAYGPDAAVALRDRAVFHARCALLEDLAFGLENGREPYVEKSLAGLAWLFSP